MKNVFSQRAAEGEFFEYFFFCPGCQCAHGIRTASWPQPANLTEKQKEWFKNKWTWNNNFQLPTVSPSVHVKGNNEQTVCHSFITSGRIQFLGDSIHKLAGQTVALEPWEEEDDGDDGVVQESTPE